MVVEMYDHRKNVGDKLESYLNLIKDYSKVDDNYLYYQFKDYILQDCKFIEQMDDFDQQSR